MVDNRLNFSCVDLFCGAGGLAYGFNKEGIRVNAGIDSDPACRYPFSHNNKAKFFERDVCKLRPDDLKALFTPNTTKVLAGCAPCQPFSTYSHRYDTKADGKWRLLNEFGRLVKAIEPEIVTMENVPSLVKRRIFDKFVRSLKRLKYDVWYDVVECAAYGVPQTRRRLVLLASLFGPIKLIPPLRTPGRYKTVKQAIGRYRRLEAGESYKRDRLHVAASLSEKNLERIRASKPGGTWRDWPAHLVAKCHRNDSGRTYPSVYGRMEWGKPSPTMTTQCFGFGNGRFGHPEQDRAISLREAAVLQGFPRHYEFVPPGEKAHFKTVGRLIGNAVPVDLGRAIAKSIMRHIKNLPQFTPQRPYPSDPKIGRKNQKIARRSHGLGTKKPIINRCSGQPRPSSDDARRRMQATGQRDTPPELKIRKRLFAMGYRYRVDHPVSKKPRRKGDIVFTRQKVAVFVDGCFWHGCPIHGTWPKANADFWRNKIQTNIQRDTETNRLLEESGWLVIRIWEHENPKLAAEKIARTVKKRAQGGDG